MKKNLFIAATCFFALYSIEPVLAQSATGGEPNVIATAVIERKIEALEKEGKEREKQIKDTKSELQTRLADIGGKIELSEQKLLNDQTAFKNEINSKNYPIYFFLAIIGIIGIPNLFLIPKLIDKKIEKFFLNNEKLNFIKQLIKNQQIEYQIKMKTKILILAVSNEKLTAARERFRRLNFENVETKTFSQALDPQTSAMAADYNENDYNLIVFHEPTEDWVDAYTSISTKEIYVCYYTEGQLRIAHREKVNFANSPFTLYARTLEVLKYQHIMDRSL